MNPRKAAQREPGLGPAGIHVPEINLRHLIAVPRAGVEQGKREFDRVARGEIGRR